MITTKITEKKQEGMKITKVEILKYFFFRLKMNGYFLCVFLITSHKEIY